MMPLAEYAIMHVQVLTGSDYFVNLVQWISFCSLLSLGFLIANELGLDKNYDDVMSIEFASHLINKYIIINK